MKTYRFSSFGLKKLRRRFLQKAGLRTALLMGGLFLVFSYQSQQAQAGSYWFMVALLFLIGGALVIGFARSLKKQEAALKAIRLVVDDEFVALQQADTPEVRIARAEVTALKETSAGLCVLTADPLRSLLIPSGRLVWLALEGGNGELRHQAQIWRCHRSRLPLLQNREPAVKGLVYNLHR